MITYYLDCVGIGFIFCLLTFIIRPENFQPRGVLRPHNSEDQRELEEVSGPEREEETHTKAEDQLAVELAEKMKLLSRSGQKTSTKFLVDSGIVT